MKLSRCALGRRRSSYVNQARAVPDLFQIDSPLGSQMASGGAQEDDGGPSLDIDNVHMLLQGQPISALCEVFAARGEPERLVAAARAEGIIFHLCVTLMRWRLKCEHRCPSVDVSRGGVSFLHNVQASSQI